MRRVGYRYQRTLERSVNVEGFGYLTGRRVRLRFRPAAADTGLLFQRVDLPAAPLVPARVEHVTGANRRTTLGHAPAQVELVEHVLAALHGLRIDNCVIEVNAPEPPGLDGSAVGFTRVLQEEAGVAQQTGARPIYAVEDPVTVTDGRATLTIYPCDRGESLRISYLLDYGSGNVLGRQRHTQDITPEYFLADMAMCRTFLLEAEAEALRCQGIGSNTSLDDLLVFGPRGPLGGNRLRFADEPARHKALDILGDLTLFGYDLRGHVVGYRSGHALNVALVRRLVQELPQRATQPVQSKAGRALLRVA